MRKIIVFISLCFIGLSSCEPKNNFKIKSIWYFIDNESGDASRYRCDSCDRESKECCEFKFRNEILHRMESYTLNADGGIDSIYNYNIPLGVNIYSLNEKVKLSAIDTPYVAFIKNFKVRYEQNQNAIVIDNTIYKDFEVDKKNKQLVVKNQQKTMILEYE